MYPGAFELGFHSRNEAALAMGRSVIPANIAEEGVKRT